MTRDPAQKGCMGARGFSCSTPGFLAIKRTHYSDLPPVYQAAAVAREVLPLGSSGVSRSGGNRVVDSRMRAVPVAVARAAGCSRGAWETSHFFFCAAESRSSIRKEPSSARAWKRVEKSSPSSLSWFSCWRSSRSMYGSTSSPADVFGLAKDKGV